MSYVMQQSTQVAHQMTQAEIQAQMALNARVQLGTAVEQWTRLAGPETMFVRSAQTTLSITSTVAEIESLTQYIRQITNAGDYCTRFLDNRSPALSQILGMEKAQRLQQDVHRHINVIAYTSVETERSESVFQLLAIEDELKEANRILTESASPLSELNQRIDGHLLEGAVANIGDMETISGMGAVRHAAEAWYISAREQSRLDEQSRRVNQAQNQVIAAGPPDPALTVAEQIRAGTKIESVPAQPIHFTLNIEFRSKTVSDRFRAQLMEDEKTPLPLTIQLNREEVNQKGKEIRETIQKLFKRAKIKTYFNSRKTFDKTEMQKDWEELVNKGAAVLEQIFDKESLDNLRKCLGVNQGTAGDPMRSLRIETAGFFLPWEMLAWPATSKDEPLQRRFWGFQYNITRSVGEAGITITKPKLIADDRPDMLFFALADRDPQATMLRHLDKKNRIYLNEIPPLTEAQREQEITVLPDIFKKKIHVVHFGCHAYAAKEQLGPGFEIKDDFHLTLGDIQEKKMKLTGTPLVFLNACETGITSDDPLHPKAAADFVRVFLRNMDACGVIATEYQIPERFAPAFALAFYWNFLTGKCDAGDALLHARQRFLKKRNNPMGLFFSAYLEPETRISINSQGAAQ